MPAVFKATDEVTNRILSMLLQTSEPLMTVEVMGMQLIIATHICQPINHLSINLYVLLMWYSLQRTHTRDKYITDTHSPCGTVHSGHSCMRQVHHRHTQPMWHSLQLSLKCKVVQKHTPAFDAASPNESAMFSSIEPHSAADEREWY